MTGSGAAGEPVEYLVAHVRDALLADERLSEQGVEVAVVSGRIVLRGELATPERRDAALAVARAVVSGLGEGLGDDAVLDDLCVASTVARADVEDL